MAIDSTNLVYEKYILITKNMLNFIDYYLQNGDMWFIEVNGQVTWGELPSIWLRAVRNYFAFSHELLSHSGKHFAAVDAVHNLQHLSDASQLKMSTVGTLSNELNFQPGATDREIATSILQHKDVAITFLRGKYGL